MRPKPHRRFDDTSGRDTESDRAVSDRPMQLVIRSGRVKSLNSTVNTHEIVGHLQYRLNVLHGDRGMSDLDYQIQFPTNCNTNCSAYNPESAKVDNVSSGRNG